MAKDVIINGKTYPGVVDVALPTSGGTALFKDEDEIPAAPSGIGLDKFDDNHWMVGYGQGGNLMLPAGTSNTTSEFYPAVGTLTQNNEMTFWLINVDAGKTYRIYTADSTNVSWDWCQLCWRKSFESGLGFIKRDTSSTGVYISEYTATAPAGAAYMQFSARRMGNNDAYKTIRVEEVT